MSKKYFYAFLQQFTQFLFFNGFYKYAENLTAPLGKKKTKHSDSHRTIEENTLSTHDEYIF